MKKLVLILMCMSIITLVSAVSCDQSGYRWCEENTASYGDISVLSRLYFNLNDANGDMWDNYPYAVGALMLDFRTFGSADGAYQISNDGYIFYNKVTWDDVWSGLSCVEGGCSMGGYDYAGNGQITLAIAGQQFTDCIQMTSISHALSNDYWAYSTTGYGWSGTGGCFDIRVVECRVDGDCSSGYECDTSGSWQDWNCEAIPSCVEDWSCSDWSSCRMSSQTRSCVDNNNCGTTENRPETQQSCTCTESWTCDEWTECVEGGQTRECEDVNVCGTTDNKPTESRECEIPVNNTLLYTSIAVIAIFIIALILIIIKKRK